MKNLKEPSGYLLSALSGLTLVLIFPRFDVEILAWFALVPLFFAIQNQSLGRASLYGFIAGMIFYFFGLIWIADTIVNFGHIPKLLGYLILGALAAYLSFYVALFCCLVCRWSRGRPLYVFMLAPPLWTSLEYIRSTHLEYGFSWLGLGYSQYKSLAVIQISEYTGVYGVATLIVLVNAALYCLLHAGLAGQSFRPPKGQTASIAGIAALALTLCLGYGAYALDRHDVAAPSTQEDRNLADGAAALPGHPSLLVALVQGNIEQDRKWNPLYRSRVMRTYSNLTRKAGAAKPDLIVWPEAATPFYFILDKSGSRFLKNLAREIQTPLLFGSPYSEQDSGKIVSYNSAYLISAEGEPLGRYDKIHLVPFGEFVPFQKLLWFVRKMATGVGDFGRGDRSVLFTLSGFRFGLSICYEIAFPDLARRPVKAGAQFLVNITNDAWFGRSAASYQHLGMAALRAVENRAPIVRAANTGISGTIDPSGRIRDTTELFVEDLVLTRIVPRRGKPTWYSRNGDIFSFVCMALTAVAALLARVSEKR
ncbi:MAG: apolipoprotein N-acyltransferase [Nitrospinales bacterium]